MKIISKAEYLKENKKPIQEKVWDSIAKAWNKYVVKKIPFVVDFLKSKKGKVIDLGCGDGRNMIDSDSLKYYGVDFSGESLKHAKIRGEREGINAKLFKLKIDKLDTEKNCRNLFFSVSKTLPQPTQKVFDKKKFKDNMFDYGLFIASLHCLESSKERKSALKEFYRVLKPNAEALISVWNSEDKKFKCVKNHGDIYMSWKDKGISHMRYYYLYSRDEFLSLLKSVGFEVLEFYKPVEGDRFSKKNWVVRVRKR